MKSIDFVCAKSGFAVLLDQTWMKKKLNMKKVVFRIIQCLRCLRENVWGLSCCCLVVSGGYLGRGHKITEKNIWLEGLKKVYVLLGITSVGRSADKSVKVYAFLVTACPFFWKA